MPDNNLDNNSGNTVGRLDLLAMKLLDRVVDNATNPVIKAMYPAYRNLVENQVTELLGPGLIGKKRKTNGKGKR